MYQDHQDKVDAYLSGEMDEKSRIEFERELRSNEALAKAYRETKAISSAIADRKEKLNMMARWDKEEIKERLIRRRNRTRCWTIGMSAAACVAIGFFTVRPIFFTTSPPSNTGFIMPIFGNDAFYRSGDSSTELLDSIINAKDYEHALVSVDSLIYNYNCVLRRYEGNDSLTAKEAYEMEVCKDGLEEFNWRRVNLLIALGKTEESKECLKRIVNNNGYYAYPADSLIQTLTK